jgi:surface protein
MRKKIRYICVFILFIVKTSYAIGEFSVPPTPFVTKWQTDGSNNIIIPLTGGGYDFTIDWGDGTTEIKTGTLGNISHAYSTAGIKTVSITANVPTGFPRIYVNNFGNRLLLKTIESWGSGQWGTSVDRAFYGANNLEVNATDIPNFSNTTNFQYMFLNCTSVTGTNGFANWTLNTNPTANVSFSAMFHTATQFNGDISNWDVSRVNTFDNMFNNAQKFNQNIGSWNVSNVTNMSAMFQNAILFNQNIGNWNVANVTNMNAMFNNANVFAQDISGWNVGNVTTMSSMFQNADAFDIDISGWNVSNVTNMSNMFNANNVFNQDLSNWDVSSVTTMSGMFRQMPLFNAPLNWGTKTGNVTTMQDMFRESPLFNQDIDGWDVSKVTTTNLMFYRTNSFNQSLNSWNVGNLIDPRQMFQECTSFNGNISSWVFTTDPAKNVNAASMFQSATSFNQDISLWNVERFTSMASMFRSATSFNQNIGSWNVANVTNMSSMFDNANSFAFNIGNWNVGNVTNMSSMFQNADAFNIDISGWNVSNVTNMSNMFNANNVFNQDLSNWDVSSVTNMSSMFRQMPLFNAPLNWGTKTGNVTTMQDMFRESPLFNQDIDGWDVSKVTNTFAMFWYTTAFNQPLNSWNVGNLVSASHMFGNATSFNQDISTWNISKLTNLDNFLVNGKLSRANYDALLLGWSTLDAGETVVPLNLKPHFGSSKYSNTAAVLTARNTTLIANKNWTITDGGIDSDVIIPFIESSTLASNNATISITFSENVYPTDVASGSLEATNFLFSLSGGTATLNTTIPSSISFSNNLTFVLGIDINGTPDGTEVLTVTPVLNSIFDISGNAAATTQSNNTAQLNDFKYPIITGPNSTSGLNSSISINENTAAVHTFLADEVVNWSLGNTNDEALLSMDSNGNLVFNTAPDFENPLSTLNSNTYVVEIIATDAANNTTSQTLIITILDIANSTFGTFATITKQYFAGTHTIVPPTTNNSNPIVYTSDNLAVATVSGLVITFTGVGTANITATQAADANYEGNAISTLLTVLGKDLVSKYGGISSTSTNYVDTYGNVNGAFGLDKYGKQEYVLGGIVSSGLVMHLDASNPVSYLGSGSTWTDLSGNGNHGTLQNGVAFTNINNGAMVFDGVNDYFVTNNNLDLSNTDKLTIQIILKTASSNTQMIMEHSDNWNSNNAFGIICNNLSDKIQITDHNQGYNVSNSVASVNNNNWHLFTATTDRSLNAADQNLIYIDDNAANKVNVTNLTNDNSGNFTSHKLYISARAGSSLYFNGAIAQVLIYNRVLTAAEIEQNYNVVKLKYGL